MNEQKKQMLYSQTFDNKQTENSAQSNQQLNSKINLNTITSQQKIQLKTSLKQNTLKQENQRQTPGGLPVKANHNDQNSLKQIENAYKLNNNIVDREDIYQIENIKSQKPIIIKSNLVNQVAMESHRNSQRRSQSVVKVNNMQNDNDQTNNDSKLIITQNNQNSKIIINNSQQQQQQQYNQYFNTLNSQDRKKSQGKIEQIINQKSLRKSSGKLEEFKNSNTLNKSNSDLKQGNKVGIQYDENSAMNLLNKIQSKEQLAKILSNLSNKHNGSLQKLQEPLSGYPDKNEKSQIPQASTNDTVDQINKQQKLTMVNNQDYRQKILDSSLVDKMAKIKIQVIDGKPLEPNLLVINAHGLENLKGYRDQRDGMVHFGSKKYIQLERLNDLEKDQHQFMHLVKNSQEHIPYNDYVFETEDGEAMNFFGERHFYIQYDYGNQILSNFYIDANRYLLRDSGLGSGTFLKIQRDLVLKSGQLISIGKDLNFLVMIDRQQNDEGFVNENMFNENQEYTPNNLHNISSNSHDLSNNLSHFGGHLPNTIQNISINFIEGMLSKNDSSLLSQATLRRQHQFTQNDVPILIGRTQECKVRFKEGALSRLQCRIDFIDNKWIIKDGNGRDKQSTNGTWLWVAQPSQLEDGDIFKAGNAIFQVNYTQY